MIKWPQIATGINEEATRISVQSDLAITDEAKYREYIRTLANLLSLNRDNFNPQNMLIEDYIAKGAMEERNSIYNLQNYVIGLSEVGLTVDANEELDLEKSFKRVNYFALFENQTVRNNVQKGIGNRPIDFVATQIPLNSITAHS